MKFDFNNCNLFKASSLFLSTFLNKFFRGFLFYSSSINPCLYAAKFNSYFLSKEIFNCRQLFFGKSSLKHWFTRSMTSFNIPKDLLISVAKASWTSEMRITIFLSIVFCQAVKLVISQFFRILFLRRLIL